MRLRDMGITLVWLGLAGCAAPPPTAPVPPFSDPFMTLQSAADSISPGRTTKAELAARLGPATTVQFASGVEVWIYSLAARGPAPQTGSPAELVILVEATGVVKKIRLKPAYAR